MLKSNSEVRQDTPEFLTANLSKMYIVALDLKYFSLHSFHLMLIKQVVNLKNVGAGNYRTDLNGALLESWAATLDVAFILKPIC